MSTNERRERVWGPYPHGSGWRVITTDAAGARSIHGYKSKEEADCFVTEYRRLQETRTIVDAIDAYTESLAAPP